MKAEMIGLDYKHPIRTLYLEAWQSFECGEWSYDGATFVRERYSHTIFELAAFIHDWRNSMGYTGYYIDRELIDIMICLNYPFGLIQTRWFWTRLTFFNIIRHKVLGSFKNEKPKLIFSI